MQVDMVSINNQFAQPFAQSIRTLLAPFAIDAPDIMVSALVLDSREVAVHSAFVALKGHQQDGRDFIPQAISLGAKVIIRQCDDAHLHGELSMREQSVIIDFYQLPEQLSQLAAHFYQQPATSLSVIAVTGTNGKTSVVQLSNQLAHLLGERSASIGTLGAGVYQSGQTLVETSNTTPDAISMQRLLAEFVGEGVAQVALEASSHALVQQRLAALKTDVAIFTNLTRDHLDYHHSMENYAAAKRRLLHQPGLGFVVVNGNDAEHTQWLNHKPDAVTAVIYGLNINVSSIAKTHRYCIASNLQYTRDGVRFSLQSSWGNGELRISLIGPFNVANVLAAITGQLCLGKSLKSIVYVAQKLRPVAGRMELFSQPAQAAIVVDYAHTPDALEKTLLAIRQHCHGKLWCIFGCGGDRDSGKRPLMGEIAERLADAVIVTDDNVRSEDPAQIIQQILAGCHAPQQIQVEHNRAKAISLALQQSAEEDVILVAGKGHENYQIIGQTRLPYDEREFVKQLQQGKNL